MYTGTTNRVVDESGRRASSLGFGAVLQQRGQPKLSLVGPAAEPSHTAAVGSMVRLNGCRVYTDSKWKSWLGRHPVGEQYYRSTRKARTGKSRLNSEVSI